MKKLMNILIFQLLLSIISAILLSQMSWLGRIGISLLYKEYVILKEPTRTTPIIFGIQFLVILILCIKPKKDLKDNLYINFYPCRIRLGLYDSRF